LIQINSISAIPYFIKIYPNLEPELKEKVENFVKNVSNNKIFYYLLPYAKTKDIQLCSLIISIKIKDYQHQIMFVKLLIKKCYKETELLEELLDRTKPVCSYTRDVSVYGCYDMAGNVREWTISKFDYYPGHIGEKKFFNKDFYIVRGGSYKLPKSFCLTYRCDVFPKITKLPDLGFRCVKDIE
jgi:hypothetical protein